MEDTYKPVNDDFYEALGDLAAMRKVTELTFMQHGSKAVVRGTITAVYEEEGAGFIRVNDGLAIRMDRLVEVDGRRPEAYC